MSAPRAQTKTRRMMTLKTLILVAGMGGLSACLPGSPPELPASETGPATGATQNDGKLPVTLYEKMFAASNLNTQNMGWRFSYLSVQRDGSLNFTNGAAQIMIDKLPSGQAGDLKLEILEAGTVRYEGILRNQVLNAGTNNLTITLVPVGGTADVLIQINIGNGSPQNPISTPVPSPTPMASPVPGPTPIAAPNTTPGTTVTPGMGLTWSKDIKKIMDRACVECHAAGGRSPNLSTWPLGTAEATSAIIDRVIAVSGVGGTMPPAPRDKISAAELDLIRKWKAEGLKP